MKYVKLVKGMDYRGHGVKAFSGKPLAVDDEKAKILVGTGFFAVDATVNGKVEETEQIPIEKMKKDQLVEFAEQNKIDISACTNNDERVAMIKAAVAAKATDDADGDGAKAGFEE